MTDSSFLPASPQPMIQPFWIALMVSVGFHGLLWITLPTRMGEPRAPIDTVDLVELTPEQLQRLPNLNSSPPLNLPPLNPQAWQLPPAPPSSIDSPSTLSLPSPRIALELPPPPILQLPPLPSPLSYREPPPLPSLPPPPPSAPPTYNDANPLPTLPPEEVDVDLNRLAQELPENTLPSEPLEGEPPVNSTPAPLPDSIPEAAIADLRRRQEKYQQPAETPENSESREIAEIYPPTPADRDTLPEGDRLLADLQALRDQITYNPEGTTPTEAAAILEPWFAKIRENHTDLLWQPQDLAVPLPALACRYQIQGQGSIGALVDAEANLVGEPALIQSTGYPLLNEAALEAVRTHSFENTGTHQVYLLRIIFEPSESCNLETSRISTP